MKETLLTDAKDSTLLFDDRNIKIPVQDRSLYPLNKISTCKYNIITFLPKNLLIQFQKLANIYFLIVAILETIPEISNTDGIPSILLPLTLVLTVSAIRDLIEDRKRRKSDNEENSRKALKFIQSTWTPIFWSDVQVGDLIQVHKDQYFPADLILCASSDHKGLSYIETKNIDGETNLKQKVANKELQQLFRNGFNQLECEIKCEEPNPVIYKFSGVMKIGDLFVPLSEQQFLIRGSSLKNTNWVIGLVVYTGHQSKIMLNSVKGISKFSSIEKLMNRQIFLIFFVQIILCCFCAGFYTIWFNKNKDSSWYLKLNVGETNLLAQFMLQFFTWMLNFTNLVPISLLVTLEMVKYSQAIFITLDLQMYNEATDTQAKVQSCSLNEELGQINYIFSDKTGTLTCNQMEFRKLSVNGQIFGTNGRTPKELKKENVDFVDPSFKSSNFPEFCLHLACCQSIITEGEGDLIEYRASSPDELALVSAASIFGYRFMGRDADQNLEILLNGELMKVRLLNTLEFTSERKRMSVIIKLPNGTIKLLCKGADSVIIPRLAPSAYLIETQVSIYNFAKEGLRTLILAEKELKPSLYNEWNNKYTEALKDIHNRQRLIEDLSHDLEHSLTLIGVSAIEDKLQDYVPDTISSLKNAGIQVWVLTGDKIETATSIALSCNLLTINMKQVEITALHKKEIQDQIKTGIELVSDNKALIISGDSLIKATFANTVKDLIKLADSCKVVLACRVSPQQKAQIVELIREYKPSARTLSVGDGANDVNMITAAHVGVGISGLEGQQASRASDYSISQFSYLRRLLFVHGRECYRRNSTLICYNFYKNILFVLPLFVFGLFSVFSGQLIFNTWTYQLFNVTYAALPICVYAVFDREMELDLLNYSHYYIGIQDLMFSTKIFWKWVLEGIVHTFVFTVVGLLGISYASGYSDSGRMNNVFVVGTLIYGLMVILSNLKILTFTYSFYWFNLGLIFFSIIFYFYSTQVLDSVLPISEWLDNYEMYFSIYQLYKNPNAYLILFLVPYICFFIQPFYSILIQYLEKQPLVRQGKVSNYEFDVIK